MSSTLFATVPFMTIAPYTIPEVEAEWGIPAGAGRWQDGTARPTRQVEFVERGEVVSFKAAVTPVAPAPVAAPAKRGEPANLYPGACRYCGVWVEANGGTRANVGGKWLVAHLAGTCPEPAALAPVAAAAPVAQAVPELGYYLHDGQVVRVVKAKTSDRRYAKRISYGTGGGRATWDYVAGLVNRLTADERLTVEQAAAYGHLHGNCMICGLALTVPKSVERGIGPVCFANL